MSEIWNKKNEIQLKMELKIMRLFFIFTVLITSFRLAKSGSLNLYLNENEKLLIKLSQNYTLKVDYDSSLDDDANYTLSANLDSGHSFPGTVDIVGNSGNIVLSPSLMDEDYGTHVALVKMEADTGHSSQVREVVILYEEPITSFKIVVKGYVQVGVVTTITAKFDSGSNLDIEYVITGKAEVNRHEGKVRLERYYYTFTSQTKYTITAIASNTISRAYETKTVTAVYAIYGFSVVCLEGPRQTTENIECKISLDPSMNLEVGPLHAKVNYDNGVTKTYSLTNQLSTCKTTGFKIAYRYPFQGNFTIRTSIVGQVNTLTLEPQKVFIWNKLGALTLATASKKAKVDENVTFDFLNLPDHGFLYRANFGDGIQSINGESALFTLNNVTKLMHSYSTPGVYYISMEAWNPFYFARNSMYITVQYPIIASTIRLSPGYHEIPIPGAYETYTMLQYDYAPSATNVTCNFYSGEKWQKNVPTTIAHSVPITKYYTYRFPGKKTIMFQCRNLVSSIDKRVSLYVRSFKMRDFRIHYQQKVNMNMSKEEGDPPRFSSDNVTVVFRIQLFAVIRPPPNITFHWDFADGSPLDVFTFDSFYHKHMFADRGTYDMKIRVTEPTGVDEHTHTYSIQLGVLIFTADRYKGVINITEFELIGTGIGPGAHYVFTTDYDDKVFEDTAAVDKASVPFIYRRVGTYYPMVVGTNSSFYERVYIEDGLMIDWSIRGIGVVYSNLTVHLPPGNLTLNVSLPLDSRADTTLTCIINFGDKIDRKNYTFVQNFSSSLSFVYEYTYLTLGVHSLYLSCFNLIESFVNTTIVVLYNPCFVDRGIYDRQYSNPLYALRVVTSLDTDLSSRMPVKCFWLEPRYYWTVARHVDGKETVIDYKWYTIPSGTFRFWKGTMKPGIYKVSLKVALIGTWLYEFTYLKFERTEAFSQIAIGNRRFSKRMIFEVDAKSQSYNPESGPGRNEELTFVWYCYKYNNSYMENGNIEATFISRGGIPYFVNNSYSPANTSKTFVDPPCKSLMENVSPGIVRLKANTFDYDNYIVVVEVGLEAAPPSYTYQMISIVPGEPPTVMVKCKINCRKKTSSQQLMVYEAFCLDCEEFEFEYTAYEWKLMYFDPNLKTYVNVEDFEDMTLLGVRNKEIGIKPNKLKPGSKYLLQLVVVVRGRKDVGRTEVTLNVNHLPYGGSCSIDPTIGNATTTVFIVNCPGWKDEGSRESRDSSVDEGEPLTYSYSLEVPRTVNGTAVTEDIQLFFAGESSLSELMLPVGDGNNDYKMTIVVEICDVFGGCTTNRQSTAKVVPQPSMMIKDPNETSEMNNLFETVNVTIKELKAGGNIIAVIRFVGTVSSMITGVNVSEADESVKSELSNKTKEFLTLYADSVSDERSNQTKDRMNAGDTSNVIQNVVTTIKNEDIVDDDSVGLAVKTAQLLTRNMHDRTQEELYPVEDSTFMDKTSAAAATVVNTALNKVFPDEYVDLSKELNRDEIETELRGNNTFETPEEEAAFQVRVDEEVKRLQAKRDHMQNKVDHGETTVPLMIEAVESLQGISGSVLLNDEEETTIEKPNFRLTVEKTSFGKFVNKTEMSKKDFKLQLMNDSNSNSTDEVSLRTAVFNKQPYFYGKGAKAISSKGIMVTVMNGTEKQNTSLTLKISNEGTVSFRKYEPEFIPGDSTKRLYFKCDLGDTNDALMIYVKPEGFNPNDYESMGLYDVSVTEVEHKWSASHKFSYPLEIRDWVNSDLGFKVFVPQGMFPAGSLYVVLKPVAAKPLVNIPSGYRRKLLSETTTQSDNSTQPSMTATTGVYDSSQVNVSVIIATTGCRTWDDTEKAWIPSGCTVLEFSTINETACRCPSPPGQMFASTFFVPPNTIDFTGVWSKFDAKNAAVYGTCIALICAYALLCVLAHREDKKDMQRWATHFLCDSDKEDVYFYLMTVSTGMRKGAGTKSSFNFVLGGEVFDSGVRILSDGITQGFASGSVRRFIMGTQESLGDLIHLRIWQDIKGEGVNESWFLDSIIIDDPQKDERYVFVCNDWISCEEGDGMTERQLTVQDKGDMRKFQNRFSHEAKFSITDNHLWLSLVFRPNKSSFTRVQRLSCVLALLFLTMIVNAMFYKTESDEVEADVITIGSLKFSMKTLFVSIVGILITTPPVLLMAYIFKNAKAKLSKRKQGKSIEELKAELKLRPNGAFSYNVNLNRSLELSDSDIYSQDHLPLPHWTLYIAWIITFLAVSVSSFFLLLYSMEWGISKSNEWLGSFFLSFFESLVVVDPVKVILLAVVVALIFKRPAEAGARNVHLKKVREMAQHFEAVASRTYLTFRRNILSENTTPSTEHVEKVKLKRKQEMMAHEALMEIITYCLYAFIIYSIGYINRDERSFLLKKNLQNALYSSAEGQFGFDQVKSYEAYMQWLRGTLFPKYFPKNDYNGAPLDVRDRMFFSDLDNARIGPARLRQVRMHKEKCPYSLMNKQRYCVPPYDEYSEETSSFCVGWQPYNKSCATNRFLYSEEAWVYNTAKEIWGITIAGDYASYGGGGYILKLDISLENSINIINELERYKWIDRRTKAVFVEFTVYNANTNLFAYVIFLCEFTPLGGLTTWTDIRAFRPYQHTGAMGVYAILCYLIYLVVVIVTTVKVIRRMKMQGCGYLSHPWQLVDLLCCTLSYIAVVLWTLRYVYARESMKVYYNDKKEFINFQHIVLWDFIFTAMIGTLIFIATIRILKILGYNKRMTQLADVIVNASKELAGFFFCFGIVFFAFVSLGSLLFGSHIKQYRSFFSTTGSLSNALIGKNKLDTLIKAAPQVAQAYYFMYVLFVIFMLMTVFCAILNQSITEVRESLLNSPDTYGIVDVLTGSVKDMVGKFIHFGGKTKKTIPDEHLRYKKACLTPNGGAFDTPNILKLVRETFGDDWQNKVDQNTDLVVHNEKRDLMSVEELRMTDVVLSAPSPANECFEIGPYLRKHGLAVSPAPDITQDFPPLDPTIEEGDGGNLPYSMAYFK